MGDFGDLKKKKKSSKKKAAFDIEAFEKEVSISCSSMLQGYC
jgi:translation initiation factor 2 subunit 2